MPVLKPTSKLIILIYLLSSISIIFQCFIITIELFFKYDLVMNPYSKEGADLGLYIMHQITRMIFLFSCLAKINIGFHERRKIILNRGRIASRYLRTELFQDVLSLFCLFNNYIILPNNTDDNGIKAALLHSRLNIYKIFFIFNLVYLLRTYHYFKCFLCHRQRLDALLSLTKLIFEILVAGHLTACLWNLSSEYQERNGLSNSWRDKLKFVYNSDFFGWEDFYLYSLYWSLSTLVTVSFGSIPASNSPEVLVSMITVIIGCCFFAYAVKKISNIVDDINVKEKPFW